jgi:hypothetical protein
MQALVAVQPVISLRDEQGKCCGHWRARLQDPQ